MADRYETDPVLPSTFIGCRTVVFCEDTHHNVLVDVPTEGLGDDQGDPRAAESGTTLLELVASTARDVWG